MRDTPSFSRWFANVVRLRPPNFFDKLGVVNVGYRPEELAPQVPKYEPVLLYTERAETSN